MGLTLGQFSALSEEEQIDWLAYDELRTRRITILIDGMHKAIAEKKPIEMAAYVTAVIGMME